VSIRASRARSKNLERIATCAGGDRTVSSRPRLDRLVGAVLAIVPCGGFQPIYGTQPRRVEARSMGGGGGENRFPLELRQASVTRAMMGFLSWGGDERRETAPWCLKPGGSVYARWMEMVFVNR